MVVNADHFDLWNRALKSFNTKDEERWSKKTAIVFKDLNMYLLWTKKWNECLLKPKKRGFNFQFGLQFCTTVEAEIMRGHAFWSKTMKYHFSDQNRYSFKGWLEEFTLLLCLMPTNPKYERPTYRVSITLITNHF